MIEYLNIRKDLLNLLAPVVRLLSCSKSSFTKNTKPLHFEKYLKSGSGRAFSKRHFQYFKSCIILLCDTSVSFTSAHQSDPVAIGLPSIHRDHYVVSHPTIS